MRFNLTRDRYGDDGRSNDSRSNTGGSGGRPHGTATSGAFSRGAVLALAVVVAAGWVLWTSDRRKEDFAARSLNQARSAAEAGNLPLAASELQRLIETYRGTDAATEAVITLNQVRMVNGQGELAAVGLREFLATNPARIPGAGQRAPGDGAGRLQQAG